MTGAISSHLALLTVLWVELAAERLWKTYPRKSLLLETAGQVISGTFPMETFKTIHKYVTQHWSDAYVPIIRLLPDYNSRRMSQFCIVMLHLIIQPCLKGTNNCWCSHSIQLVKFNRDFILNMISFINIRYHWSWKSYIYLIIYLGKTHLLYSWLLGRNDLETVPTDSFNVERIVSGTCVYMMWDLCGCKDFRLKRRQFFHGTDGKHLILFVIKTGMHLTLVITTHFNFNHYFWCSQMSTLIFGTGGTLEFSTAIMEKQFL